MRSKLFQVNNYQLGQSITETLKEAELIAAPELISKSLANIEIGAESPSGEFTGIKLSIEPVSKDLNEFLTHLEIFEPFSDNDKAVTKHSLLEQKIDKNKLFMMMLGANKQSYILVLIVEPYANVELAQQAQKTPFKITPSTIERVVTDIIL